MKKYIVSILFMISFYCISQQKQAIGISKKKTIGLVLSGGGAKGFAHIGVLKVIDSLGIKLDYIGGTSMGAVVGALYSVGYSPKQIDSIIMNIKFMDLLTDKLERKHLSFFQKKNHEKYLLSLPFKKWKVELPIALSKGQNTLNKLNELFHPADSIRDFSKLHVPFYCMTTDLETGRAVEINKGDLANAIRSSAALPTLLTPNQFGNITTIDGGVANNFPVKTMKNKGVGIIIGVDVQGTLKKSKNIDSALKVVDQIVNFQLYGKQYSKNNGIDIYIRPEVENFGLVEFESKRSIIDTGFYAALQKKEQLLELSTSHINATHIDLKSNVKKQYKIEKLLINGRKNYTRKYIRGTLKIREGDYVSQAELNDKINHLSATNNFDKIEYDFIKNPLNNTVEITFKILESPQSEFIKLGAHYDPLYQFNGLVNYTQKHLLRQNDIFSVDLTIGNKIRGELNYFIDNGYLLSYGLRSYFNQFETTLNSEFSDEIRINFEYEDFSNYLYLESGLRTRLTNISAGLEHKLIRSFTKTFIVEEDEERTFFDNRHYFNFLAKFELDNYDRKAFPNKGFKVDIAFRSFLKASKKENFIETSQISADLQGIRTFSNRFSLFLQGQGGFTFTNDVLDNFNYAVGGYGQNYINNFIAFHGYTFSALEGNSFIKTTASFRYRLFKENYIDFLANYAVVKDKVFDFLKTSSYFKNANSGYSIGLGSNTIFGPLEIRYVWSPDTNFSDILVSAGFWF